MDVLRDKMKYEKEWAAVEKSFDPLQLIALIIKVVLSQTEDQYPYATVYNQKLSMYTFKQEDLTNQQWYERFNTRIDISQAIGITHLPQVLLNHTCEELHPGTKYKAHSKSEQQIIQDTTC